MEKNRINKENSQKQFLIKCYQCENNASYLINKKNLFICKRCTEINENKSITDLQEKSELFLKVFTEVEAKKERIKLKINECDNKSDYEVLILENENYFIEEIDKIISELNEVKNKIKDKTKKIIEKKRNNYSAINSYDKDDLSFKKIIEEKFNIINESIQSDKSILNELSQENIKDTKNIQFFFSHIENYIQKYISFSCDMKEIKSTLNNRNFREINNLNENIECEIFPNKSEYFSKMKSICKEIKSKLEKEDDDKREENNSYYYKYLEKKSITSQSKPILDSLFVDIYSYGSSKFPNITEFIKIDSEIEIPKNHRIELISYILDIHFKDIYYTSQFKYDLEKELEAIKLPANSINNIIANTKSITFEDCEDIKFIDYILKLDHNFLDKSNQIKIINKKRKQSHSNKLVKFLLTRILNKYTPSLHKKIQEGKFNNSISNLKTLYLSNCKVNVRHILNLFKFCQIEKLFLVNGCLDDEDVKVISYYLNFEKEKIFRPTQLNMFSNQITDKGFEYLFSLAGKIESINLNSNNLTYKSIHYIIDNCSCDLNKETTFLLMDIIFEDFEVFKDLKNLNDKINLIMSCNNIPAKLRKKLPPNIIFE